MLKEVVNFNGKKEDFANEIVVQMDWQIKEIITVVLKNYF